jgi:hypothetical protein
MFSAGRPLQKKRKSKERKTLIEMLTCTYTLAFMPHAVGDNWLIMMAVQA